MYIFHEYSSARSLCHVAVSLFVKCNSHEDLRERQRLSVSIYRTKELQNREVQITSQIFRRG
jgi:hypothetical protein